MRSEVIYDIPFSRVPAGGFCIADGMEIIKAHEEYYDAKGDPVNAMRIATCYGVYIDPQTKVMQYPDARIRYS